MASKTIYICDRCESFFPSEEMVEVSLKLTTAIDRNHYGRQGEMPRREICDSCASVLFEEFKGVERNLSTRLFEQYQLPEKKPPKVT